MADMTTYLMLDDVNLELLELHASKAHAVAGYVNGGYANWLELVEKYGKSGKFLLSIDVQNRTSAGAQCLDIENGDAVVSDAPGWFAATQAAGKLAGDFRYFPKLYTSADNLPALLAVMERAHVKRDEYMIWSAHYTGVAHICGPKSCGVPVQADATQWTDEFEGVSLDASLCYGYFFAGPPAKVNTAKPAPVIKPISGSPKPVEPVAPVAPKPVEPVAPEPVVKVTLKSVGPKGALLSDGSLVDWS